MTRGKSCDQTPSVSIISCLKRDERCSLSSVYMYTLVVRGCVDLVGFTSGWSHYSINVPSSILHPRSVHLTRFLYVLVHSVIIYVIVVDFNLQTFEFLSICCAQIAYISTETNKEVSLLLYIHNSNRIIIASQVAVVEMVLGQ